MKKLALFVLLGFLLSGSLLAQNTPWTADQKEKARLVGVELGAELRKMDDLFRRNFDKLTSAQTSDYFPKYKDLDEKRKDWPDIKVEFSKSMAVGNEYVTSAKKVSVDLNSVITAKNKEADQRFLPLCIAGWKKLYDEYANLKYEAYDKKWNAIVPKLDEIDRRSIGIIGVMLKKGYIDLGPIPADMLKNYTDDAIACKKAWNDQTALNADLKKSIAAVLASSTNTVSASAAASKAAVEACQVKIDAILKDAENMYQNALKENTVSVTGAYSYRSNKDAYKTKTGVKNLSNITEARCNEGVDAALSLRNNLAADIRK